jgi:hypothetical protein
MEIHLHLHLHWLCHAVVLLLWQRLCVCVRVCVVSIQTSTLPTLERTLTFAPYLASCRCQLDLRLLLQAAPRRQYMGGARTSPPAWCPALMSAVEEPSSSSHLHPAEDLLGISSAFRGVIRGSCLGLFVKAHVMAAHTSRLHGPPSLPPR